MTYKEWLSKKKPKDIIKWFEDVTTDNSRPAYTINELLYEEMDENEEEEIGYKSYRDIT